MSGMGLMKAIDKKLSELELELDVMRNTDGIKAVLAHSQAHIDAGTTGPDPANPNTFLGRVVNVKEINEGRATIIPSFWDGKRVDDRESERRAIESGIKWPSSDTVHGALRLESFIHDMMQKQSR